ncbi:O-methyltransferase [Francisella frigiditurris]|uniref:O-methyltransferase family protein n=1 Tax=Francisella frigiditurris TaxID=1542390 RepID=A0A1J0KVM1_9GAMM|nr:class I SAM-dependent methyltransferase [Francisella frigiditurris]APC97837.1 O-methyltransferase family protein [Francisella frigiditurris]
MSINTLLNNQNLQTYIDESSINLSPIVMELFENAQSDEYSHMLSSPNQIQMISLIIKMLNAKLILEVGVFRGFGTLAMAEALPDNGKIYACDINDSFIKPYIKYWEKANVKDKIQLHIAPALETLEKLQKDGLKLDFIYIDADKENYINYYEESLKLLNNGGVIAIDNVLWSGKVADKNHIDSQTETIRKLNSIIHNDSRVDACIIPIGDGVNLIRKR